MSTSTITRLTRRLLGCMLGAASIFAASAADVPEYINLSANHIDMNGDDWTELAAKLGRTSDRTFRVLHIGDSHIQAEMVTNKLRALLQERYGNAGRGLVSPLKLAGTNQPVDYTITSDKPDAPRRQTRLLKTPWPVQPGVTGIAEACDSTDRLTIKTTLPGHEIASALLISSTGTELLRADSPCDSICLTVPAGESFYGAVLENGKPGLLYSAIGNNGACFNDYSLINGFAADTRLFSPDLVVLSMGTNEGFSTMTDEQIAQSVDGLFNSIKAYNPEAKFLILAPMECQRDRNHGNKPLSGIYDINDRVAQAHDIIVARAASLGIPVWDFYAVAGGHGASQRWVDDSLMNPRDHIHLLKAGYELQAQLLYDALTQAFDNCK